MRTTLLLLALLLPAHAVRWAYEGSLHPFDSTSLRWQESTWEGNTTLHPPPLAHEHLLIVLITTTSRLPLVLASRRWRQGLHTVIVSDCWVNETEYAAAFAVHIHVIWCFCILGVSQPEMRLVIASSTPFTYSPSTPHHIRVQRPHTRCGAPTPTPRTPGKNEGTCAQPWPRFWPTSQRALLGARASSGCFLATMTRWDDCCSFIADMFG